MYTDQDPYYLNSSNPHFLNSSVIYHLVMCHLVHRDVPLKFRLLPDASTFTFRYQLTDYWGTLMKLMIIAVCNCFCVLQFSCIRLNSWLMFLIPCLAQQMFSAAFSFLNFETSCHLQSATLHSVASKRDTPGCLLQLYLFGFRCVQWCGPRWGRDSEFDPRADSSLSTASWFN